MSNDELLKEYRHILACAKDMRQVYERSKLLEAQLSSGIERGWTIEQFHKNTQEFVKSSQKLYKSFERKARRMASKLPIKKREDGTYGYE